MKNDLELIKEIQDSTYELMSAFHSGLSWLMDYCEKNNIPLPDLDKVRSLVTTTSYTLEHSEYDYNSHNNRKFTGDGIHRRLYRALKQYSYKVLVPYHTVW